MASNNKKNKIKSNNRKSKVLNTIPLKAYCKSDFSSKHYNEETNTVLQLTLSCGLCDRHYVSVLDRCQFYRESELNAWA